MPPERRILRPSKSLGTTGSSAKRGLELDGPGGSSSENERNKRVRSEAATRQSTPGPSASHASSSSATLDEDDHTGSGMVLDTDGSQIPDSGGFGGLASPSSPDEYASTSTTATAHRSGLFPLVIESDAEEQARPNPTGGQAAERSSPRAVSPSDIRASLQRYEAFDSNISALRESASLVHNPAAGFRFRSPTPTLELPPIAQLTSNSFQSMTLPALRPPRDINPGQAPDLHEVQDTAQPSSEGSRRLYRERLENASEHINSAIHLLLSPAEQSMPTNTAPTSALNTWHEFPILEEDDVTLPIGHEPRGRTNTGTTADPRSSSNGSRAEVTDRVYGRSLASYLTALNGPRESARSDGPNSHDPPPTIRDLMNRPMADSNPEPVIQAMRSTTRDSIRQHARQRMQRTEEGNVSVPSISFLEES